MSTMILAADGAVLYKKCAGCHGALGGKKALGKSKMINELSKDALVTSLNGYKNGSYGGSMKPLMKGQVSNLSEDDIETLSTYIASLK